MIAPPTTQYELRITIQPVMHIGVLTHNYPRFPGDFSGVFVEALCQELVRQEQQVTVWAPFDAAYAYKGDQQPATDDPLQLHLYRYIWPDPLHRLGYMRSMQADLMLRLEAYLLSPLMFAAGIATVMRQARQLRPQVLHAHWLLPNGFMAAVVSRRLGIPLVISVPGSDAQVAGQHPLFRAMARFALRQAHLLTANSAELRDSVVRIGAEPGKFDLIIYGTDPQALRPDATGVAELRSQWQTPSDGAALVLLCVGRMVPKKGFDVLIRALAEPILRQRNLVVVLVGEGDNKVSWQQLAQELGVAHRLRWVGNVPKTAIGLYYNACDLLLNPAVNRPVDGLNVCVLDAMSCGKPVIGSTVAGNPLAIVDGVTGLITPAGDVAALAQAIARLGDDAALRQRMGAAGRARIEQELGWPPLARRYLQHFSNLQNNGRHRR